MNPEVQGMLLLFLLVVSPFAESKAEVADARKSISGGGGAPTLLEPKCPDFFKKLPKTCLYSGRKILEWCPAESRCMTFAENQTQACLTEEEAREHTARQSWSDCAGLSCSDPLPWMPRHCPGQVKCPEGSQCSWNYARAEGACLPSALLWNVFDDWSDPGAVLLARPICDSFCHIPVPGLKAECNLKCFRGYTCLLDDWGVPQCIANPKLWRDNASVEIDTAALPGGGPLCQRALDSYGRNMMDHMHDLVRADRVVSDMAMSLVFVPAASGVVVMAAALLCFGAWAASCACWGWRTRLSRRIRRTKWVVKMWAASRRKGLVV